MFRSFSLSLGGHTWQADSPVIVGILNATPDSFFIGSRALGPDAVEAQAETMLAAGAHWLDIGGCSTRPGAELPSLSEEWDRVAPGLQRLVQRFPDIPISIDTFRGEIAHRSLDSGAHILNDISGGSLDPSIWAVAAQHDAPYILTHYPAGHLPTTMNDAALGTAEVTASLMTYFQGHIAELRRQGVHQLLIDPGFGFGKTVEANYRLLRDMTKLHALDLPLFVGISRKSMLWRLLGSQPEHMVAATSAMHLYALEQGAQLLRVHDAREAADVVKLWQTIHAL